MERSTGASERRQGEHFGWQLVHDRERNLVFYLHSYTGEVRWLPPRQSGFVMHGMRPLPVSSDCPEPQDWSPYFPHVVMAPSGLLPVHDLPQQDFSDVTSSPDREEAVDRPLGPFNRFPLRGLGVTASGQRILPPTWEDYTDAPPFLPPYPVVVLPVTTATPPEMTVQQEMATLLADLRVSQLHRQSCPKLVSARGIKEHNRKGYMLRQARKLMKELGELPPPQALSAPGSTSSRDSSDSIAFSSQALSCADSISRRSPSPQSVTSPLWC